MRTKIGIIAVYLLLGCFLFEEATPYFNNWGQSQELCEIEAEAESQESQKEESSSEYSKDSKVSIQLLQLSPLPVMYAKASPATYTETFFVSAESSIFSPPPELI
jgi:hypothetical protein